MAILSISIYGASSRGNLPRGYLIVQQVAAYNASVYGAISTVKEADSIFGALVGTLNGIEFEPLYYDAQDMNAIVPIAQKAREKGIDLWSSTFRLRGRIRALGTISSDFQAWVMDSMGTVIPAVNSSGQPMFDVLNPDAMDWFLPLYRIRYIQPMKGLLQGLMFNEDRLAPLSASNGNSDRPKYWSQPVYSIKVLTLWQTYCAANGIRDSLGNAVDKFPVHLQSMEAAGDGKTKYYPGYLVPAVIHPGQAFASLPHATGVWKAWQEFLAEQFATNWIARLSNEFLSVNINNPEWYGAAYFQLHMWGLPYEQITNPLFVVDSGHKWGAWGLQYGVDLQLIAGLPEIDLVVCETYPPIRRNLEDFISEYKRITRAAGKQFGVMLHRDDTWKLGAADSEANRWALIDKTAPDVIERFPYQSMLPSGPYYDSTQEKIFRTEWAQYCSGSTVIHAVTPATGFEFSVNAAKNILSLVFTIPENTVVNISLYDASGRRVRYLVNGRRNAATYKERFNCSQLSSGMYYCRMKAKGNIIVKSVYVAG